MRYIVGFSTKLNVGFMSFRGSYDFNDVLTNVNWKPVNHGEGKVHGGTPILFLNTP
jgi:hypothetical protein